jgi:AraC-like DNA-binding protein
MVKSGHHAVKEVHFRPPAAGADGIEVLSLAELARRLARATGMDVPQRVDFHHLFAVEDGMVGHMIDFTEYVAEPGSWLWVRPGQIQQFRDLTTGSGWVVLFQPLVLDPATGAEIGLDDPLPPAQWQMTGPGAAATQLALQHLIAAFDPSAPTSRLTRAKTLQHLLAVLLLQLTDRASSVGSPATIHTETFLRFQAAVEDRFATTRHVGDYAYALGYTPRTLTRATLASAGVGAKEFVDRRVILEARRLLAHSEHPVGRIADLLGFDDASNFVKFFAKRTGTTPANFRRQFRPAPTTENALPTSRPVV